MRVRVHLSIRSVITEARGNLLENFPRFMKHFRNFKVPPINTPNFYDWIHFWDIKWVSISASAWMENNLIYFNISVFTSHQSRLCLRQNQCHKNKRFCYVWMERAIWNTSSVIHTSQRNTRNWIVSQWLISRRLFKCQNSLLCKPWNIL